MKNEILTNDSYVLAERNEILLVTNDKNNKGIFFKAFLADRNGNVLSEERPVSTFIKRDYWKKVGKKYNECKNKDSLIKSALLGFAVGDAFGVPYEFTERKILRNYDYTKMIEYGTHNMPMGTWSDDTSMTIATMDSIIKKGYIDYKDIMDRFISWAYLHNYSAAPEAFGLGEIVLKAMKKYLEGIPALECGGKEFMDNGNGALMRIMPIALYCIFQKLEDDEVIEIINNASQITHGHDISKMSCYIYTKLMEYLINHKTVEEALDLIRKIDFSKNYSQEAIKEHQRILSPSFNTIEENSIKESGYVVDTLEIVIYSLLKNSTYENTIIECVGMGYDTDTTAAIAGALAGIIYGEESIPKEWLNSLKKKAYLENMASKFEEVITNTKIINKL